MTSDEYQNEIWKDVPGYGGLYQISDFGRCKSIRSGKLLKALSGRCGHKNYVFCVKRKMKSNQVHRLVMLSFVGPSNLHVNHKNGIPNDNRLSNLEYVTIRDNAIHYTGTGNRPYTSVHKKWSRWASSFMVGKHKRIHVGTFDTPEKASHAYVSKLKEMGIEVPKYAKIAGDIK